MKFGFDPADEMFRQEVRAFLKAKLPEDIRRRNALNFHPNGGDTRRWTKILNEKGWAAPSWPKDKGGSTLR